MPFSVATPHIEDLITFHSPASDLNAGVLPQQGLMTGRFGLAVLLLCCVMAAQAVRAQTTPPQTPYSAPPSRLWGRIANPAHRGERVISALFFAGPPNPASLPLYTRHPQDAKRYAWTNEADIGAELEQMRAVGLNTLKLSYWGHDGETEQWSPSLLFARRRWPLPAGANSAQASKPETGDSKADDGKAESSKAGANEYSEAEQAAQGRAFFRQAQAHGLLVAPMLEVSPAFRFYDEFPDHLDNLVNRAAWLLKNFGAESNWLQLYDQMGKPRHVIWLIETIHPNAIDPRRFAQGFEDASRRLAASGYRVGFVIDPTPLPPYGSHEGPDPQALQTCASLLAVNPFNITSQGITPHQKLSDISEAERQAYAESILKRWAASPLPLIAPLMPGYDAHLVFPTLPVYGFTPAWRQRQKELALKYQTAGLSIDIWNGWTEGYAIPPSVEEGDVHLKWVQDVIQSLPR